ncbi:Putative transcriptional regulator [Ignavibacterium album JCM 16511]|uniref:Putative transcriptional regulator n=1 Tax=Ignavibacterium album (strain DSM 19864 / JCM 16511 / NBRC 101810 / Mat9-16) TaxID=945713 RepID=I0AIK1_IGNAJ|nr:Rrf2 family transcriptional regulator [Ignavibacterium album]AFH48808.1 Putative transcriptional regulator [Ignavibacterium album JCM 16511]
MRRNSFISREQDYALRMTAFLAGLPNGEFISIPELAEKLFISKKFASRIIHKLKKSNITDSVQGRYGGVFIKADPEKLSIFDVLNTIGFKVKFNDCLKENFACELMLGCKFHSFWMNQEFLLIEKLKKQKISDYVLKEKK